MTEPNEDIDGPASGVQRLRCIDDISQWMASNRLKLNVDKTQFIWLGSFSASLCWQRWHDCTTYSDRALWSAQFPRRCTPDLERYHLISRTVVLVANSSSQALRLGSLCKPTHKRRLWELCLSGALQILDLIDWLIYLLLTHWCVL